MMHLTIIGFGNQSKAWAMNLKDSHFPFNVGLRPESSSFLQIKTSGLKSTIIGTEEFYNSDVFALLIPDHLHDEFLSQHAARIKRHSAIIYAHGYSVVKHNLDQKYPHLNHLLFAPKSIGSELRAQYLAGGQIGAVYSNEYCFSQKQEWTTWLHLLSKALGIKMGPFKTTFKKETNADLFSEQGLLCSLIPYTAELMFNHLVSNGTEPELAYLECWHELKLIINAMVESGPLHFFNMISPNALVGSEKGRKIIINSDFQQNILRLFREIENGTFDQELDSTNINVLRSEIESHWKNSKLAQIHLQLKKANT
jgi:ketol-acid reductoisomerase